MGATLASAIKDIIVRCDLQLRNCRGQAYDGASSMSGSFSGVASRVRQEECMYIALHTV